MTIEIKLKTQNELDSNLEYNYNILDEIPKEYYDDIIFLNCSNNNLGDIDITFLDLFKNLEIGSIIKIN